jgi:hypothetical protein
LILFFFVFWFLFSTTKAWLARRLALDDPG